MRAALVTAAATALVLAGCGGGNSSPSKAQLRSQATRVCATTTQRSGRIATPQSPSGGLLFLKRGIAVLRPELAHLRTLRTPSELSDAYAVSLTAFSRELHALEKTAHELTSGNDPVLAIKTLQARLAPLETREDGAWRTLDIPACMDR